MPRHRPSTGPKGSHQTRRQSRARHGGGKQEGETAAFAAVEPRAASTDAHERLVMAVPKGRVLSSLAKLFEAGGVDPSPLLAKDRTLLRKGTQPGLEFILLKPDDVPTYVEYGAADMGIVGRDVLMEREYDVYWPLDLGIGVCRMVVAGKAGQPRPAAPLRVATKYLNVAHRHFHRRGLHVDLIFVQGSVELAPLTGLADAIVDLVETGETLRQNGLEVLEHICDISSVVIVNRSSLKLKRAAVTRLLEALEG